MCFYSSFHCGSLTHATTLYYTRRFTFIATKHIYTDTQTHGHRHITLITENAANDRPQTYQRKYTTYLYNFTHANETCRRSNSNQQRRQRRLNILEIKCILPRDGLHTFVCVVYTVWLCAFVSTMKFTDCTKIYISKRQNVGWCECSIYRVVLFSMQTRLMFCLILHFFLPYLELCIVYALDASKQWRENFWIWFALVLVFVHGI